MPGYLTPAQPTLNAFNPTGNISSTTIADAIIELDSEKGKIEQTVRVYDSAAARTSALPSPTEGMMTYLKDVKAVNVYNGTTWVAIGGGSDINPLSVAGI
jgi:hypothetical protein